MTPILLICQEENPVGYYVYLHLTLTDSRVFYVGKGKDCRYRRTSGRNYLWRRIAREEGVQVLVLQDNMQEADAYDLEIKLIAKYGKLINRTGQLANLADGGPDRPIKYR